MPLSVAASSFVGQLVEAGFKPFHKMELQEARDGMAALFQMMGPGPQSVSAADHEVEVTGGTISVRLLMPSQTPQALIIYYHGGGWALGTIDDYDGFGRRLAEVTGCAVLLVNYRLAPEFPYPTPVDDAEAAFRWASTAAELSLPAGLPVIVAGDSAGGAIAAAVARRSGDVGGPRIAAQMLLCPVVQADRRFPSQNDPECQVVIGWDDMAWFWDFYAPNAASRSEPDASPLCAQRYEGLPPSLIITAQYDVNRDPAEQYASNIKDAGVAVELVRFDGEFHAFPAFSALPSSDEAMIAMSKFVKSIV